MDRPEYLALSVPQHHVKAMKDLLQAKNLLNKVVKIAPEDKINQGSEDERKFVIPTNLKVFVRYSGKNERLDDGTVNNNSFLTNWLATCTRQNPTLRESVQITSVPVPQDQNLQAGGANPVRTALLNALQAIDVPEEFAANFSQVIGKLSQSYCIYPPLLLLPSHSAGDQTWLSFLGSLDGSSREIFLSHVATELQVSHIANNAPVPLQNTSSASSNSTTPAANILRSPTNITPLYGDFGPELPPFPIYTPNAVDFAQALWVSTVQNGITQTWAPRYTMFSAGNITEKTRLLTLPSIQAAVAAGRATNGCTAVDLFAGIGYFAFSYARAGVSKVLCWDLNPWSIEGLRRGAALNRWWSHTITEPFTVSSEPDVFGIAALNVPAAATDEATRLVLFPESNELSRVRIPVLREAGLPPIRHVNCGMLPDAYAALAAAVEAVDQELGGWIHFHQVVGEGLEMDEDVQRTVGMVLVLVVEMVERRGGYPGDAEVLLEHVERVKSVAPRRWHVVLDIWMRR